MIKENMKRVNKAVVNIDHDAYASAKARQIEKKNKCEVIERLNSLETTMNTILNILKENSRNDN